MDNILIIYPILPVVLMNFIVLFHMRYMISRAIKKGDVEYKYFKAYEGSAPDYLLISRHHYKNFFETPILFYLLCLVLYIIDDVSVIDLWIAWLFVIFKCLHSYIRITSNYVRDQGAGMGEYMLHMLKVQKLMADKFSVVVRKNDMVKDMTGLSEKLGGSNSAEND